MHSDSGRNPAWRFFAATIALFFSLLFPTACAGAGEPVQLSFISFNDFHGQLLTPPGHVAVRTADTENVLKIRAGGAAYLATRLRELRAMNPGNTLFVAAGDLVGASPQVSGMFHDEPTIEILNHMGLAFSAVGNHEFDKGRDELLRLQYGGCFSGSPALRLGVVGEDTCLNGGRFEGAKFRYLAANVIERSSGAPLLPAYAVKTLGGIKVGIVGVVLKEAPSVVTPAGVAGLYFADEVETVNALLPQLREQGVQLVVVLLHQGAAISARTVNTTDCSGLHGEALDIVDRLAAPVEVVMTGHTHEAFVCHRPDGKLMTQAGHYGRLLTKIDLLIDPQSGRVLKKEAANHVIDGSVLEKDAEIDRLLARYIQRAEMHEKSVIAKLDAPLNRQTGPSGESALGQVVADAYLLATAQASYGMGAAQIAFVNPGGIRSEIDQAADGSVVVTSGHLYRIHPFGNTLVTLSLTGRQIVRLLEQQWERPQPAGGRILSVSSGFSYIWDAAQPEGAAPGKGRRIVAGSPKLNGLPIDPDSLYRVTVNSFLASGGDGFTMLNEGTERQQGPADLDALLDFFSDGRVGRLPREERIRCRECLE